MIVERLGEDGRDRVRGHSRLYRYAIALPVSLALVSSQVAWAQMSMDRNRPAGSPLDESRSDDPTSPNGDDLRRDGAQDTASPATGTDPGAGTEPYEPATIDRNQGTGSGMRAEEGELAAPRNPRLKPPAAPGEYERWLQTVTGRNLKRFGADLLLPSNRDYTVPATATIPPDYALNIGDTVSVAMTGSIEGSANFEIDRNGEIQLPRIGTVRLAGVRYRDLRDRLAAAIGRQYRGFEVSASIRQLRGVRVYVTGFANNPGAYSVNSLSTLVNAVLAAGGPSAGGSFRSVKLYRNGTEVVDFDLYDLIRRGDKSRDPLLQNEDVLFIPPVGNQVAVIGSVNEEAIYELRPGETVEDALRLAGGPTSLADASRVLLYRLSDRDTAWSRQIALADTAREAAAPGDIVQILPEGSLVRPLERQSTLVRIEGEVNRPGNYYVRPGATLTEVMDMAGGLTSHAYVFGTNLQRLSVRIQQRESFNEAVRQLELSLASAPLTLDQNQTMGGERLQAAREVVTRLRAMQPDGRVVLPLKGDSQALPGYLTLENNDAIYVPPRPSTVGVFGAVYRPASFLVTGNRRKVRDYLEEAGGPIRAADKGEIFLVRANGSIISKRDNALGTTVLPGDVIFVPVKARGSQFWQRLRDISQLIFGAGLTAATVAAIQ